MNKIFKVVWNRTIGSFVVTSELAKGRVKSSSEGAEGDVRASEEGRLKTLFRLTALSAALLGFSEGAWAVVAPTGQVANGPGGETAVNGGDARGTGAVAVGAYARAGTRTAPPGGMNSGTVAIGGSNGSTAALADGNNAIAIGTSANSNGAKAITIGSDTLATDQWTTALGGRAEAKARGATAVGSWTQATGQFAVAIGGSDLYGRGNNTELNDGSGATLASGDRSTAIGRRAKASGNDTLAFGTNAEATGVEAVAIGKGATSTASKALAFGQGARAQADDTVAVGTSAQATLANSIAIGKNSVATGVYNGSKAGRAIAVGFNTQALGEDSVAIGSGAGVKDAALAQNKQSVALGWSAKATGTTQAVAIGPDAIASGTQSTSIGNNTRAEGDSSIAIGGDDWDIVRNKSVAAAKNKPVHQVFQELTGMEMAADQPRNSFKGTSSADAAVAVGVKAYADGVLSTAFGSGTTATGLGAAAFGVGATASQDKSVAIGAGSHTRTDATAVTTATVNGITYGGFAGTTHITSGSQVSFGSAGYERQLKHVAPGEITATSTDAINGSQLYALHAGSGNIAKAVANALGGGAAVGIDPTNNQGTVTLPSYDVFTGNATPNAAGSSTTKFNATPAKNVADAMTNLNTYVNQGFAVKDNAGAAKGIVTPGESVQFADGNATTVTVDTEASGNTKIKYDVKVDDSTIKVVDGKLTGASQTHFYSVNSADKTKANYNNDGATAENAIAAGPEAKAAASNAVVMGNKATVEAAAGSDPDVNGETTGESSVAVGSESTASGKNAVAIGQQANAYGENTFAGGQDAKALGKSSIAVGEGAKANERNTIAIGSGNNAWKTDSIALGRAANADGAASLALGLSSHTREANAIALGNNANADDTNSIAIGTNSKAAQAAAVAIGNNATALKYSAVVIGEDARSNNSRSVVIGYNASATNTEIPGSGQPDYNQTVAIGAYANAWGDQSTAIGNNVDAKGNSSIAIGADDWDTVAVKTVDGTGGKTVKEVYQDYTGDVMVTGSYTHTTSSEAAVAIGTKSQAIGQLSTAFGTGTIAEGVASAAFGMGAKATKGNSVAIGAGSTTTTNAIEVNEATVNNLKYSGFAGGNRITSGDQVSFGSSGYERQLKNVAPGEISSTSTDAINGSQLYAVQNVLGNAAQTVKNVLGGNAAVDEDGRLTTRDIGGTGQNTIDAAIRELNTNAYKPFKLTIAQTGGTNGVSENHTLQDVTSGSTITLEAGKNISLRQNGATVSINTVDNPEFAGKVTAKGGLDMGGNKITNVLSGTDTKDAVNLGQLQDAMANLRVSTLTTVNNDAPFSYVGTDGRILRREVTVAPGTGVKTVSFKHVDDNTEYTGDVTIAALNPTDPQTTTPTTVGNVKNGAKDNDAVNVSQLNKIAEAIGTKVNPDGTITAPTYSVISGNPSTSSVAGYNKVGDALTALSNAVRTPLNFEGDTGTKFDRQLGSTVAVKGGQTNADKLSENNIGVVADKNSGTLNVKLAKELTGLTSAAFSGDVTAAGTTVNGSGVTIGSGSNPVSLTAGGLSNGGNKVTNIADGVADTDAASFKQVKAAKTEVQGGTNVASVTKTDNPTDGHTVYTVNAKGAAVALDSSVDGLKLTSSEDTTTNVTTYKLDLSDKTKASLTKADSALQNIGVQVNDTDAKTLTKDDSTLNFVNGTGTTAENKNGTVAFNVNKSTLTASTGGLVSADKAGDAFATAADVAQAINEAVANSEKTSVVEKGDNTHVTAVEAGNKTTYTVHADNTTVSVKDGGKLKLESSEKANANQTKTTNYELDLTDAAKAEIQKGVDAKTAVDTKGITFNGDSGSPVTKKLDETLAIKGDDKNVVTEAVTDGITVKLKDDIKLTSVTAETLKAGDSILTSAGLTTPKVTAGDSVLTTDGLKIGDDSSPNQVSLTTAGLNNGGNKITKVAEGTDDTDGVNVSQIKPLATALNTTVGADGSIAEPNFTVNHADGTAGIPVHTVQDALNEVGKELNKGLKIAADNGNEDKVNLGETVTYTSKDKNIVTTVADNEIDFSLADKITVGKAGQKPVVIDGTTGTVSGLTNKTLGGADFATKGQAATEEQLNETQANLKTILGGEAANNNGNVTTNNIGETGANNVHDAIKSVKETAEKGWKLKVNEETSSEKINPDDEVAIKQGKNITVTRNGKNITVATAEEVEFNKVTVGDSILTAAGLTTPKVTAGNSVLTTDGLKIGDDSSPNQVSLTTAGLNNGGNKITKVAEGTDDTDGVNVSQIKPLATALNTTVGADGSIAEPNFTVNHADGTAGIPVHTVQDALNEVGKELNKGLKIAADNGNEDKVNLGETVTYTSKDKNIVTTSGTGKAIDFSLAEKVTIGKDAANGGKPVVIDGKEGIVSGLTNTTLGSAPLAGSDKAATEAQLDATQVNLATILGGNAANNNGNVTTNNIGETGANNVHDAIKSVKETADKGWNLKANDEADSEKIAAGDTVTVKQGKNIRVKRSGKDLTVETEDDVEFAHVKADSVEATSVVAESVIAGNSVLTTEGLKIGADGSPSQVSLTNAGLNNGGNKIANVAKGTAATDAVNVAQLNEQLAATEKTTTVVAGKNVTVSEKVDGNNTEYTVNADKTTLSQAANGAVKVSEGAKDADGVTDYALDLTDEAKADIAKGVAAKDAVDNKGLTFAADNGTTGAKKLGDSLSVKGDGNILTRADENGIGFSLADKITVGKAGNGNKPLVIDGTAGLISGLSNTTLGGADFATKGQAASEEQLNAAQANLANLLGGNAANNKGNVTTTDIGGTGKDNVHDAIVAVKETADKGWNLNANDETSSEKIGAGDTVTFKEGKNVKVSRNGKHITVATSDDVSFDKVTVGDSVLTDNGLTVGNGKAGKPVSLTKDGLNNGGNKVSDIAAGEADTDAVNVAQLKAAAAKATSKVDSGNDNIVVTPEQNADGSTTYKVATAPNLKADSFTAGDTVVNNDGVKVGDKVALGKDGLKAGDVNITADGINAGNKAISNVAAGVKDTDAANVGQLNRLTAAAKTEVEAGTNIASVTGKQGKNGQTVYTVNADGASVSAGSDNIVVTKGNKDANNVTDYAVDLSKAVKADIAKGVAAKDAVDNKGISFAGDSGTTVANKLGDTVAVKGDANITTTAGANGIQVGLNKDLKVDSVKAGDTVVNNNGVNVGDKVALGKDGLKAGDVNITADGINAGGNKVTGVAAGTVAAGSTDAVNGGQLHQVYELIGSNGGNVNTAPPSVEADGKAGLGNIKNITLVDNSNNPNVTNVTNETKIAQSNGYSLVTYNVEDQGMYVTNNVIEAVGRMNEQGIKFFHTNDGEVNPDVQARNSEDSSASGAYATAVGFQAASKGTNAIAIGKGAKANAENTIAIGTGNIVSGKNSGAIGDPTVVSGNSSYSIGNNNNVSADNAYALGSNIKATVNDSVYLGDRAQTQGIHTADAAKGEAYTYGGLNDKAVAGKAGSAAAANKVAGVVTVGNGTDETRQVQGVAAGVVSADSTDAINGSQLYYTNQAIANVATQATAAKTEVTAGKNVVVNQTTGNSGQTVYNVATADKLDVTSVTAGGVTVNAQGVSIAAPTAHNPANTVSLSPIGLNNGGQRITNVAPAKEGTDAVNLNQLAGVGNALQNNIERVGKKAYAGVAGAIAQGSIPQVTRPGATGIGVGSGYYGGQSAMAIGVSAMSDGGNWVVKGNFSANTDGHVGVGAGALYQW